MTLPADSKALTIRLPWWAIAPLLLLAAQGLEFVSNGCQVSGNTIDDADSLMRLAWLREVVAHGGWDGGFFDRNGAPWGMVLHWTLPFNLLILGIAKLFWFMPFSGQLQEAGFWTGPILRVAIAFAGYWTARQVASRLASAFAACLILFSPYMLNYADQGAANHHPLLYLDTVLAAGFAFALSRRPQGRGMAIGAGAMIAFCLWCSFELVVVAGGFFAWLFLLWVREGPIRTRQLLLSGAAFAAATDMALLIDPPNGSLGAIVYDHISMPLQTLACLPLAAALCLSFVRGGPIPRLVAAGTVSLALGGLYLAAWPGVVAGVEGAIDPYVRTEWLSDIGEVRPIHSHRTILMYLGPALLGILLTPLVTRKRIDRAIMAAGLLGLCIMGQAHYRFADYAVIAGALALASALDRMQASRRLLRVTSLSAAILLGGSFYSAEMLSSVFGISLEHVNDDNPPADNGTVADDDDQRDDANDDPAVPGDNEDSDDAQSCDPYDVAGALNDDTFLNAKPDAIIMADINMTPKILYWTHDRTVAGNYHRDNRGIKDNYLFFRDLDDKAAATIAKQRGVDFVLICGKGDDADYSYSTTAKARTATADSSAPATPEPTLYTRLAHQTPPPWLKLREWPETTESGLLLYQVDFAAMHSP